MYNEKKKITNDRYLSNFLTKSVRIPADMVEGLKAAAAGRNESTSKYIVQATRERMERDGYTPPAPDDTDTGND